MKIIFGLLVFLNSLVFASQSPFLKFEGKYKITSTQKECAPDSGMGCNETSFEIMSVSDSTIYKASQEEVLTKYFEPNSSSEESYYSQLYSAESNSVYQYSLNGDVSWATWEEYRPYNGTRYIVRFEKIDDKYQLTHEWLPEGNFGCKCTFGLEKSN